MDGKMRFSPIRGFSLNQWPAETPVSTCHRDATLPNQLRPASGLAINLPLRSPSVEEQFPNLQHLAHLFGSGQKTFVFVSRG